MRGRTGAGSRRCHQDPRTQRPASADRRQGAPGNHVEGGTEATVAAFSKALETGHRETILSALDLLATHFCDDEKTEGYRKDGPVAFAKFDADPGDDEEGGRDRRIWRQRRASATVAAIVGPIIGITTR